MMVFTEQLQGRILYLVIILWGMLTACSPTTTLTIIPTTQPTTTWGDVITIGQAPYLPAPNLLVTRGEVLTSWVGENEERVYQGFRRWQDGQLDTLAIPVLDSIAPFEQQIYPADNGGYHLLWMDIEPLSEQLRLFSAYLDDTLTTIIAPETFTTQQVIRYTASPDVEGALWVVWSGGLLAEPALYTVRIDGLGRPMFPERLRLDGDYPVFATTHDNITYLYWTSQVNQRILRGMFLDGQLTQVRAISHLPPMDTSDRLIDFSAMFDSTHQYLFWNIVHEDGRAEAFLSTSPITSETVITPQPITINTDKSQTIQTGFNSGTVYTAVSAGETILSWAKPLDESAEILPVVVQEGTVIGVAYFQGGAIIGHQALFDSGRLLRPPRITSDRDRHLYVAWSQPTAYGYADLNLTTTR